MTSLRKLRDKYQNDEDALTPLKSQGNIGNKIFS